MARLIGYLGPEGTFTEAAALQYDPSAKLIPLSNINDVGKAVDSGNVDEGVIPIENSLEGSVNDTLDLLINDPWLRIRQELVLAIDHCLLVKPNTEANQIELIYSHPQALAQCRLFLDQHFPEAQMIASLSTASAVQDMKKSQAHAAAIATARASELYQVEILSKGIQDSPNNATRFVVVAHTNQPPTGRDKTSVCISYGNKDQPGLLYKTIREFAVKKINLAKIESRPTKSGLGDYIFLIDFDGHQEDPVISEVLDRLRQQVFWLKIFGSYRRWTADDL